MSLKEDATTVAVLGALRDIIDAEYEAARLRVFSGLREARDEVGLKSMRVTLPDGAREISRAWRCGDLDLYRMLPLESARKVTVNDSG